MKKYIFFCVFALFFAFFSFFVLADIKTLKADEKLECRWEKEAELVSFNPIFGQYFGKSASIYGDVAVVGAPLYETSVGEAYVFRYDGKSWQEEQKLSLSDEYEVWDRPAFGTSVSVWEDVAVVGAPKHGLKEMDSGIVYVFRYDGESWVEEEKIEPKDITEEKKFGYPVVVEQNRIAVGAVGEGNEWGKNYMGAVYIFEFEEGVWKEKQKIVSPTAEINDFFGEGIALDGESLAVSSHLNDEFASNGGAVFYYEKEGEEWQLKQSFSASDVEENMQFGRSVGMSGNVLAVGTIIPDFCGTFSGKAYIFEKEKGEWFEKQDISPSNCQAYNLFGTAVDVESDEVVVGASGMAYLFSPDKNGWFESDAFNGQGSGGSAGFGSALDLAQDRLIAGAHSSLVDGIWSGKAHIFKKECGIGFESCPGDLDGDGKAGVSDLLLLLESWGECPDCLADLNGNGVVDNLDILELLSVWGKCDKK